ncbi:MAG: trypsin-like peptidase domain-containing protein [Azospirillaceae bacterium]|nr:trypsin-like peptidase domain-containing protein [Azospirillaceae bacterium]
MSAQVVIRILSGARKGQVETIPLVAKAQISLGRGPGNTVAFDADADASVSRQHAKISIDDAAGEFRLSDEGSTHGTFVNGQKITGPTLLEIGDEIALGPQTNIIFDVNPRPEGYVARTKALKTVNVSAKKTTIIDTTPEQKPAQVADSVYAKVNIGSRANYNYGSKRINFKIIFAGIVVVLVGVSGFIFYKINSASNVEKVTQHVDDVPVELSTQQVAEKYSKSTVYVGVKWRLFDKVTGKPVFHKYLPVGNGNKVPLYVTLKDLGVVPWLTTDDNEGINEPIGFEGSGSGFVISPEGQIITNKHVAAGWMIRYDNVPPLGYIVLPNVTLLKIIKDLKEERFFHPDQSPATKQLRSWIPGNGGVLFEANRTIVVGNDIREFSGRNEELFIQFPGSKQQHVALLEHFASDADVAMIRISQTAGAYSPLVLARADDVQLGQKIVVLGYPGISQKIIQIRTTNTEAGAAHTEYSYIHEPTITDGVIANLGLSGQSVTQGEMVGTVGDVYQLTVLATGHGNSGGPVLNSQGEVVGIFTYSDSNNGERVTYAVPIKYARQLFNK